MPLLSVSVIARAQDSLRTQCQPITRVTRERDDCRLSFIFRNRSSGSGQAVAWYQQASARFSVFLRCNEMLQQPSALLHRLRWPRQIMTKNIGFFFYDIRGTLLGTLLFGGLYSGSLIIVNPHIHIEHALEAPSVVRLQEAHFSSQFETQLE